MWTTLKLDVITFGVGRNDGNAVHLKPTYLLSTNWQVRALPHKETCILPEGTGCHLGRLDYFNL